MQKVFPHQSLPIEKNPQAYTIHLYLTRIPAQKMVFNLRTPSFTESESIEDDPTPPKSFSLKELRVATHKFSEDNVVWKGPFSIVYQGRLADGSPVAVKRACRVDRRSEEDFEAQVRVGSTVSTHPNVLCLRGFCRTKKELLLVYPFMINNSLSYNLRERPDRFARPLDWTTRKRIASGVARGLAHLHNQGNIKILHLNICASSILLNVHLEAVIGGFSFVMIMHEGNVVKGTIGGVSFSSRLYENSADSGSRSHCHHVNIFTSLDTPIRGAHTAPGFLLTTKDTPKNDVFAYGYMLLELISGRSIDKLCELVDNENLTLEEWIGDLMNKNELERVVDPNLQGNYLEEEAEQLVRLALLCAHVDPSVQPEMSEVVRMLESWLLQRDPSSRSSWSQSEYDSTPYYSFPPSPSPSSLGTAP